MLHEQINERNDTPTKAIVKYQSSNIQTKERRRRRRRNQEELHEYYTITWQRAPY
jgi:hypothetical protein